MRPNELDDAVAMQSISGAARLISGESPRTSIHPRSSAGRACLRPAARYAPSLLRWKRRTCSSASFSTALRWSSQPRG